MKLQLNFLTLVAIARHQTERPTRPLAILLDALGIILMLGFALFAPTESFAQTLANAYPSKPITLVVA